MGNVNTSMNTEAVMPYECFDGYFEVYDNILGLQKYIQLKPGCKGSIEASENFENGVLLVISVERDASLQPSQVRLSHDGFSLGGVDANLIYIPTIVNGTPTLPTLERLNTVYSRQNNINATVTPISLNGNNYFS